MKDNAIRNLYGLVENDEQGREILINLLSSKTNHQFFDNYNEFLSHIAERDLIKAGAGSRKTLRTNIFTVLGSFIYVGIKVGMAEEAVKKSNIGALKSFSFSVTEEELEKTSKIQGMFNSFSSLRNHYLSMHADLQSGFSERYNFSPYVLSALGLGPLSIIGKGKLIKAELINSPEKKQKKARTNIPRTFSRKNARTPVPKPKLKRKARTNIPKTMRIRKVRKNAGKKKK